MKSIFAFTLCLFAFGAFAQQDTIAKDGDDREILNFSVVERIPIIRGCANLSSATQEDQRECMQYQIAKHVGENFEFPEKTRQMGIQGKIYITFVIEKNGKLSNVNISKGVEHDYKGAGRKVRAAAKELDKEAIRVIKLLEFLEPAFQRGKPVRMSFTMPINAKLT